MGNSPSRQTTRGHGCQSRRLWQRYVTFHCTKVQFPRESRCEYRNSKGVMPTSTGEATTPSDGLVFFGATGDLAYKKIFPALQSLVSRGRLTVPIVGVAKAGWSLAQLRDRARASVCEYGGGVRDDDFARFVALLRYVDGDYRDPGTFDALRQALGEAVHPRAIWPFPPACLAPWRTVWRASASLPAQHHRREAVRPRRCIGARTERVVARGVPRKGRVSDRSLPRQSLCAEHPAVSFRQYAPRARLEPQLRRERADHHGGRLRRRRQGRFLRRDRLYPRCRPEPSTAGRGTPGDGSPQPHLLRFSPR